MGEEKEGLGNYRDSYPLQKKQKELPPLPRDGRLSIICELITEPVCIKHNFPTNGVGRVSSFNFSCPYAEKGGTAFCRYQNRMYERCNPFEELRIAAIKEKIDVDKEGNGQTKILYGEDGNPRRA